MRFSIILPSLLSDYPGSATGKDQKLTRAINSVLSQSFTDFELIVISDDCRLTDYLVNKHFAGEIKSGKVVLLTVDHDKLWSNRPRNAGIDQAQGEYIIYIDSDDKWGVNHLSVVNSQLSGEDWVYFNDRAYINNEFVEREVDPTQYGHCGTSTICHASKLNLRWNEAGYGHDFKFIQQLLRFPAFKKISTPEYFVCHVGQWSI